MLQKAQRLLMIIVGGGHPADIGADRRLRVKESTLSNPASILKALYQYSFGSVNVADFRRSRLRTLLGGHAGTFGRGRWRTP